MTPIQTNQAQSENPAAKNRQHTNALRDLLELAEAMHGRHREPREIEQALARQAALWRQLGANLFENIAREIVRRLPGLDGWNPDDGDPDALTKGIDPEGESRCAWFRRAQILMRWLETYAGTYTAEAAVRAVEIDTLDYLRGRKS
jgi:hypothetical protein